MANNFNIRFAIQTDTKGVDDLKNRLSSIKSTINSNTQEMNNFSTSLRGSSAEAENLTTILNRSLNQKSGMLDLSAFNTSLNSMGVTLSSIQSSLTSTGSKGVSAWSDLNSKILSANTGLTDTGRVLDNISKTFITAFNWNLSTTLFRGFTNEISNAYQYIKDLDSSLNDIRIVTGQSKQEMADFAIEANNAAKELGATTLDYTNASLIYAQQGLQGEELKERARITTEVANVTNKNTDEISQRLTAVWNGYKVSASEAETYVDKLSAVAAGTASDLDQLSEAMSKVASSANVVGLDVDRLNAGISTIISVTQQSASKVGNSIKTILARLGDLSLDFSKADEMGVTFGDVSNTLNQMGISVLDANNDMRQMSDVFDELGEKWQTLNAAQKQAAAVALGGKYQYNTLISWFDNYDMYQNALEMSMNSQGALQEQQDIYMDRITTHLNQLQTSWEGLYNTIAKTSDMNVLIDAFTKVIDLTNRFEEGLGGGLYSITNMVSNLNILFSKQLATGISNVVNKIKEMKQSANNDAMVKALNQQITDTQSQLRASSSVGTPADVVEAKASLSALENQRSLYQELLNYRRFMSQEEKTDLLNQQNKLYMIEKEKLTLEGQAKIVEDIKLKQTDMTNALLRIQGISDQLTIAQNQYDDGELTITQSIQREIELRQQIKDIIQEQAILSQTEAGQNFDYSSRELSLAELEEQAEMEILNLYNQKGISQERLNQIEKDILSGKDLELKKERELIITNQQQVIEQKKQVESIQRIVQGISLASSAGAMLGNIIRSMTSDTNTVGDKVNSWGSSITQIGSMVTSVGLSTGNLLVGGIGAGVTLLSSVLTPVISNWVDKEAKSIEKLEEKFTELAESTPEKLQNIASLENMESEYDTLAKGVDRFGHNISLTSSQYERYQEIVKKAISYSDDVVLGYDAEGNAIVNKNNLLKDEIKLLREKLLVEQQDLYTSKNVDKKSKSDKKKYDDAQGKLKKAKTQDKVGNGNSDYDLELLLQYTAKRERELEDKAEESKNESYNRLRDILLNSNFDYQEMYKKMQDMTDDQLREAVEEFSKQDQKGVSKYIEDFINQRNDFGKDLAVAKSKSDAQFVDPAFLLGLFQTNYSDTYEQVMKLGSDEAEGLLQAYINGMNFNSENTDYDVMAKKVKAFSENLVKIFNDPEAKQKIDETANDFDMTYKDYVAKIKDVVNNNKDYFSDEDGNLSSEMIETVFGVDDVKLNKSKDKIVEVVDDTVKSVEDGIQDNVDRIGDKIDSDKLKDALLNGLSREDLQENIDYVFDSLNYSGIEKGTVTIKEAVDQVKKELDFKDQAQDFRSSISQISTALDTIESGNKFTKDDNELFAGLEDKFNELREIGDRTSDEYQDALRRIREESNEGVFSTLVQESEMLEERLANIDVKVDPEQYFQVMDELEQTRYEIDIAFNTNIEDTLDDTYSLIDRFQDAADLLTENYQITFDEAAQLAEDGFSGMLVSAQSAGDGMIQLNSDIVHDYINGKESELYASKQQKIAELQDEKTVLLNKKQILVQKLTALQQAASAETNTERAKSLALAAQYQGDYDNYCKEVMSKADKAEEGNVEVSEDAARLTEVLGGNSKTQADNQIQAVDDADTAYSQGADNAISYYSQLCAKLQEVSSGVRNAATGGIVTNGIQKGNGKIGIGAKSTAPKTNDKTYSKTDNSSLGQGDYDSIKEALDKTNKDETDKVINDAIKGTQDSISDLNSQITSIDGAMSVLNASSTDLTNKNKNNYNNWKKYGATSGDPDDSPSAKKNKKKKSGSGSGKKKGGSGSKKANKDKNGNGVDDSKEAKESDFIDEQVDVYHDIDIMLKKISSRYEDLERNKKKVYGKSYLNTLDKEKNLLNAQIILERNKLAIVRATLQEEKASLKSKYNIKFDSKGGIKDYNNEIKKWQNYYNNKMKKDPENKSIYKDRYKDFKELMESYEKNLYTVKQETLDGIDDIKDKLHEAELEKFTYNIELKLDTKEIKREWLEFCLEISNARYENRITDNIVPTVRNTFNQLKTYLRKDGTLKTLTDSINSTIKSKTLTSADKEELLKDYQKQIEEAYLKVQDLKNVIEEGYLNTIQQANDAFDDHLDKYDVLSDKLDHEKELIDLLYGETNYVLLGHLYQNQHRNNLGEIEFLKKEVDYWSSMSGKFKEGTKEWEEWHKNLTEATQKLDEKIEDSIKNLADAYENAIDSIFKNLTMKLSGDATGSLDSIGDQWDRINTRSEKYLSTIESINGIENLISKIQKSIDESTDLDAKEKLKNLQSEELSYLSDKKQLTQYDLDRAEALYNVTLKQVALEEAQNSKKSMKMVRNDEGNYTYNYVADTEEVKDVEDELREAQNSLYELDVDAYNNNLSEMYDIYKEWQEKIKELYIDSSLTAQELEVKKSEIADYYSTMIANICGENETIKTNLYESTFTNLASMYQKNSDSVKEWLNKLTGMNYKSWNDIEKDSSLIMTVMNKGFGSMIQEMIDTFSESPNSFKFIMLETYARLDSANKDYDDGIKSLEDTSGESFTNIAEDLDGVNEDTKTLKKSNEDLIETYDTLFTSVDRIYKNFASFIGNWEDLESSAKKAAKAAEDYLETLDKVKNSSSTTSSSKSTSNSNLNDSLKDGSAAKINVSTVPTDGSAAKINVNSSTGDGKITKGEKVTFKTAPYYNTSSGSAPTGSKSKGQKVYVTSISSGAAYPYHISTGSKLGSGDLGWVKKSQLKGFDTGGYTGEWSGKQGKLALLHKKEIVLNESDTSNILKTMSMVREMTRLQSTNISLGNSLTNRGDNNYNNTSSLIIENLTVKSDNAEDFFNQLKNIELQARQKTNETK